MGKLEPSDVADENINGATTLGNSLEVPQKVKPRVTQEFHSWVYTPRERKIGTYAKACSRVIAAAVLMRAKRQK